jgi:hypothetical protein
MTIRTIAKVQDGKIVVDVPGEAENASFEVTLVPVPEDWEARKKMAEERLRIAQTMKGIFKDCKYAVNEEDVYHQ